MIERAKFCKQRVKFGVLRVGRAYVNQGADHPAHTCFPAGDVEQGGILPFKKQRAEYGAQQRARFMRAHGLSSLAFCWFKDSTGCAGVQALDEFRRLCYDKRTGYAELKDQSFGGNRSI